MSAEVMISRLLADDPVCGGRVTTGTIAAIARLAEAAPQISFAQAETVGARLHDHWIKMMDGAAPMAAGNLGWADVVQFVVRAVREAVRDTENEGENNHG
jgi:hypothetical protein